MVTDQILLNELRKNIAMIDQVPANNVHPATHRMKHNRVVNQCDVIAVDEVQNATIAPKDEKRATAICDFLRQKHERLLGTHSYTNVYRGVEKFIKEIEEPFDASIEAVFKELLLSHWDLYINRAQCTRRLSQFSLNRYRVCTLLCLQSTRSEFPNGRSVIKSLHWKIMEFVGNAPLYNAVETYLNANNEEVMGFPTIYYITPQGKVVINDLGRAPDRLESLVNSNSTM